MIRLPRLLLPVLLLHGLAAALPASAQQLISPQQEQQTLHTLLRGYFLAATGAHREAAPLIGNIGLARQDREVLESAIRIAIQAGDLAQAQKYAAALVAADGSVKSRQIQVELYILNGELARAEPLLANLMAAQAQTPADLYRQLGNAPDKQQAVALGKRLFPRDADGFYHLALLAYAGRQFAEADEAALDAYAADRRRLDTLFLAGRIAQTVRGDNAPLQLMAAHVNNRCGGALRHCTLDAILWAFSDYLRQGSEWRERLGSGAADSAAWAVSAGNWYEQWEMPDNARAAYQRAGETFMAKLGLARLAEEEGDLAAALAVLSAAGVANSQELITREITIAHLLSEQGRAEEALQRLQEAQQTVPDSFSLLYQHSLILEQSGDIGGAIAMLERITRLHPDNPDGWNALGYVMADNNIDLQRAKQYIERALLAKPDDPNIIDSLGWVNYRLGRLEQARRQLEKAAGLSRSAEIYAHYGEVLWESGAIGRAKAAWRQAQSIDADNKLLKDTLERYNPF